MKLVGFKAEPLNPMIGEVRGETVILLTSATEFCGDLPRWHCQRDGG